MPVPIKPSTGSDVQVATSVNGSGVSTTSGAVGTLVTPVDPNTHAQINYALDATLSALSAKLPSSVGAKAGSGSLSITPATDGVFPVSGQFVKRQVTPTIQAAAYAVDNCVGGKLTFTNAARVSGGSGIIQSVQIYCKASTTTLAKTLYLYSADPTATTITDKTAFSFHDTDGGLLIAAIPISASSTQGTPGFMQATQLGIDFVASGTSLFGVLVEKGAPTYASTSGLIITLGIAQN
jgi:hypothetical protein